MSGKAEGTLYNFTTYIWKGLQNEEERGAYAWDD